MKQCHLRAVGGLALSLALAGCASEDASVEDAPAGEDSAISSKPFTSCSGGEFTLVVSSNKSRAKLAKNGEVGEFGALECGKNIDDPSVILLCKTAPRVADAGFVVTLKQGSDDAVMTATLKKVTFAGHIPLADLKCEPASQASSGAKRN